MALPSEVAGICLVEKITQENKVKDKQTKNETLILTEKHLFNI